MRQAYKPLRSTIHVYQPHGEERIYEATTDDSTGYQGAKAKQLSGPERDILVSEVRSKTWGGGREPEHPSRKHIVFYQPTGAKYPEPMTQIRGAQAEVALFTKYGKPDELGYFISEIGTLAGVGS